MAEYSRTYENDALKSISKGISSPESNRAPNQKQSQIISIKKHDESSALTNDANTSRATERSARKVSKDENVSVNGAGDSSNNSVADTINEVPTRDQPTPK